MFDVAVFLNLGRDHLDFHADVEDYYRAKASLFTPERARLALVNIDDAHGRRLADETDAARCAPSRSQGARRRLVGVRRAPRPGRSDVPWSTGRRRRRRRRLPAAGRLQRRQRAGRPRRLRRGRARPARRVAAGIAAGGGVPGRFERIEAGQGFTVVVDYAHKPDAVDAALEHACAR